MNFSIAFITTEKHRFDGCLHRLLGLHRAGEIGSLEGQHTLDLVSQSVDNLFLVLQHVSLSEGASFEKRRELWVKIEDSAT